MKKKTLEMFLEESSKCFYQHMIQYEKCKDSFDDSMPCSSYDKCYQQLLSDLKNSEGDDFEYACIRRSEIDCFYDIKAYYNHNAEITDVSIPQDYGVFEWEITDFFNCLWFHFPVPYKIGDILWDPFHPNKADCPGLVVMTGITPLQYEIDGYVHPDSSDMNVSGYFQDDETGTIYYEVTWNYMDYEYFPIEKLIGKRRIMKALSNFIKEEISIDLFIRAYHLIMLEETKNDLTPINWFTEEGMKLAGIWSETSK